MTAPKQRLITMAVAMMLGTGLAGCADDASNLGGGTTAGTTGGATGGNTAGNTGGNTAGNTGGNTAGNTGGNTAGDTGGNTAGNTAGNTGGNTAGNTAGDTGGSTAGNTAGDTGGSTAGNTAGDTGGDTAGNTAGDTGGVTGGDTSGDTGGVTGGDTAGDTGGDTGGMSSGGDTGGTTGDVVGGIICTPTSSTFRPIVLPNATAIGAVEGLCLGCSVGTPIGVIDDNPLTVGSLNTPVGLLGGSSVLTVTDTATIYPSGRRAGFTLFDPAGALLTLTLLQTIEVTAIGNGGVEETADFTTLSLDLLGTPIIGDNDPRFLSFVPNIEFSALSLRFGSVANVLAQIGVIQACVSVEPAQFP